MPAFLEFFCGGGMARLGLGPGWTCLLANDIDRRKADSYRRRFGAAALAVGDVAALDADELAARIPAPGADLAWASFPCQDLSLAGTGGGLGARRSGAFWPFHALVEALRARGAGPRIVAVENVCGALASNQGRDFAALVGALADLGCRVGALVIDALHFLPQSRPRLFVVALDRAVAPPPALVQDGPSAPWHGRALVEAQARLPAALRADWVWWRLQAAAPRSAGLADLLEADPSGVAWDPPEATARLVALMAGPHLAKLRAAQAAAGRRVGALYRRTRGGVQRAEVRFDDVAGCLRTPAGGSSRQRLLFADGAALRSRLLSPREAARLMGVPDDYTLPDGAADALHLAGDGVAVPVVAHLARHLLEPLAAAAARGAARPAPDRRSAPRAEAPWPTR